MQSALERAQDNWIAFDELLVNNGTAVRQIGASVLALSATMQTRGRFGDYFISTLSHSTLCIFIYNYITCIVIWSLSYVFKFYKVSTKSYFMISTHPLRNRSKMRRNMRNRCFISKQNSFLHGYAINNSLQFIHCSHYIIMRLIL